MNIVLRPWTLQMLSKTMRVTMKRLLQVISVIVILIYTMLLVYSTFYQNANNSTTAVNYDQTTTASSPTVGWLLYRNGTVYKNKTIKNVNKRTKQNNYRFVNRQTNKNFSSTSIGTSTLEDVFISVKTTKSFHHNRLNLILKTWFALAREQTWIFTDIDDPVYQKRTNGHMINTNCSSSHNRKALCCKMSVEFDTFLESNKRWFCHFDDDNYVNVPQLVKLVQKYNPTGDWYLGKPSIRAPLEINNRENPTQKISFWFATGGAGFCISRSLALKMMPIASGGKFISIGEKIRLPDDVTMGYIIEHLLKEKLSVVEDFHSHLEPMKFLKTEYLDRQITFSYSRYGQDMNILQIEGFDFRVDPTRFLSLHCHLFPNFNYCPR